jgi:hypothetical protein
VLAAAFPWDVAIAALSTLVAGLGAAWWAGRLARAGQATSGGWKSSAPPPSRYFTLGPTFTSNSLVSPRKPVSGRTVQAAG